MNRISSFLASSYGLFLHFIVLTIAIFIVLYKPVINFSNLDPAPEDIELSTKNSSPIEVGFALENFAEFDLVKNEFIAEGVFWFVFDEKQVSKDLIEKFSVNRGSILEKSAPLFSKVGLKTRALFHVRFSFTSSLFFRRFPLDDHRLYIELKNDSLAQHPVHFVAHKDSFTQSVDAEEGGWTLVGTGVKAGFGKTVLQEGTHKEILMIPHIIFSLDYDRSGLHLLVIILMPLLLLFFAALAVFLVRVPSMYDASNTFMGSVFALIGYLFVAETISPQVGYMMLSNFVYLLVLICTFIIAMLSWSSNRFTQAQRGIIGTAIEVSLIILLAYLVYIW